MAGRVAALSAQNVPDSTAGDSALPQLSGVMPGSSEPQPVSAARQERVDMDIDTQGAPEAGDRSLSRSSSSPQTSARIPSADATAGDRPLSRLQDGSQDAASAREAQESKQSNSCFVLPIATRSFPIYMNRLHQSSTL